MGVDNKVNLKQMEKASETIDAQALKMEHRLQKVFGDITKMQTYWRGETYVNFCNIVNTLTDDLTRIVKYFRVTLPKEIVRKRNAYANATKGKLVDGGTTEAPQAFSKIKIAAQGDEIVFNDSKMNELYDTVEERFNNVEGDLDKIDDAFDKITWDGDAGRVVKREFNSRVKDTRNVIKDVKNALKENIRAAREAMQKAESGNTVSGEKIDLSSLGSVASALHVDADELKKKIVDWKDLT